MSTFFLRAKAILNDLDDFLNIFGSMLEQQKRESARNRLIAPNANLLKLMQHAQSVVSDRSQNLRLSLRGTSIDKFIHELWSLGSDMSYFDFDLSKFESVNKYLALRDKISLESLELTSDLMRDENKSLLISELRMSS